MKITNSFLTRLFFTYLCCLHPSSGNETLTGERENTSSKVVLTDLKDYITGFRYIWKIEKALIQKLPKWEPMTDEVPLSPHQAVIIAEKHLRTSFPNTTELTIDSMSLSIEGRGFELVPNDENALWAYQISFAATPIPEPSKQWLLNVLVLLDGSIVTPVVTELK